jgi:hypothetical protein
MAWLRKFFDAMKCLIEHDLDGPYLLYAPCLPQELRAIASDERLFESLRLSGVWPFHRCKRCDSLLQWQRSNGGWQAVSPEYIAHLVGQAHIARQIESINHHVNTVR